jgi:hypothetical protein
VTVTATETVTTTPTERTRPFAVAISTSPCFGWDQLIGGPWVLSDSVIGREVATGTAFEGRCGFTVRFSLTQAQFDQTSLGYIYDRKVQIVGFDQSNAGAPNIFVQGNTGPYRVAPGAVITNGPSLTDCSRVGGCPR